MNPLLLTDGYKVDHRRQYPDHTTLVYSNWTPRKSRNKDIDAVVFLGLQYFIKKYILHDFSIISFNSQKQQLSKNMPGELIISSEKIRLVQNILKTCMTWVIFL